MRKLVILLTLILGFTALSSAQSIESLRASIEQSRKELNEIDKLLKTNVANKRSSERELKLIQQNISSRRKLIRNLEAQINSLTRTINSKQDTLKGHQLELDTLRAEYAQYVYEGYKSSLRGDDLLFVLSATDVNDAQRRMAFMRYAAQSRRQMALKIDSVSTVLSNEIKEMNLRKQELAETRDSRQKELKTLNDDEKRFKQKINEFTSSEKDLKKRAAEANKKIEQAQRKINDLIAAENRRRNQRTQAQIDADVILSGQFGQNKGKMPYPVRGGVVIDRFGQQRHHLYNNLTINNNGINIAGNAGAPVKCVFDGEVRTILSLTNLGQNTAVLVKHGDYYTVYQNIVNVSVKVGDKVSINQTIGTLPTTANEDDHYLHFEIWQKDKKLNPETWLNR